MNLSSDRKVHLEKFRVEQKSYLICPQVCLDEKLSITFDCQRFVLKGVRVKFSNFQVLKTMIKNSKLLVLNNTIKLSFQSAATRTRCINGISLK